MTNTNMMCIPTILINGKQKYEWVFLPNFELFTIFFLISYILIHHSLPYANEGVKARRSGAIKG